MGLLRNLAAAGTGARPTNVMPVPAGGRAGPVGGWTATGDKHAQLTVSSWNGTIYGIVDAQATAQSQIVWRLWRKAASGRPEDREEVTDHPALQVWTNPNPFYTQNDLVEVLFNHYELTGEMWMVVGRSKMLNGGGPPLELWPIRPDRMRPAAHPTEFIQGFVFGSGRDLTPMRLDQVIYDWKRHPTDPYRGFSPIQAAMTDLRAEREASEYNAEFFANDATPGGLVKVPGWLSDERWKELVTRWNQQHRGRGNAHRIHVMDNVAGADYVDLKYTRKDMQFTELRSFSVEAFMRAYRISNFVLGMLADVNRATAEAADVWFGKAHVIPRARRVRAMLNQKLLPLFGPQLGRQGYEFDYDDPIPPDRVQAQAEQTAAIDNALKLIAAGVDEREAWEFFDLPAFTRPAPAPAPAAPPAAPDEGEGAEDTAPEAPAARTNGHRRPAPAPV